MRYLLSKSVVLPILMLGLIGLGACDSKQKNLLKATSGELKIKMHSDRAVMGLPVTFSTAEGFARYDWKVTYESGGHANCGEDSDTITCQFEEPGTARISVVATDRNGDDSKGAASFDIYDPSTGGNNAPQIQARIRNSGGTSVALFATISSLNQAWQVQNRGPGQYTLDLTGTVDDHTAVGNMVFKLKIDNGSYHEVNAVSTLVLDQIKQYRLSIMAIDERGYQRTLAFSAYIACNEDTFDPIVLDGNNIQVSGDRNYYNYSYSGTPTGGHTSPEYNYAWDFNGDEVTDTDWETSSTANHMYSIYAHSRVVTFSVWEKKCNYFASVSKGVELDNDWFDKDGSGLGVEDGTYYYIQADLASLTGATAGSRNDKLENADVIITQLKTESPPRHVICNYYKEGVDGGDEHGSDTAWFSIVGTNTYDRELDPHDQGLSLSIGPIHDTYGMSGAQGVDTSTARILGMAYYTDGGRDQAPWLDYLSVEDCELVLEVTHQPGGTPCATSGSASDHSYKIRGGFYCPDLQQTTNPRHIKAGELHGAFYCEVSHVDACVGGGGGGGGVPPVPR